jgi:hypothetical protein
MRVNGVRLACFGCYDSYNYACNRICPIASHCGAVILVGKVTEVSCLPPFLVHGSSEVRRLAKIKLEELNRLHC